MLGYMYQVERRGQREVKRSRNLVENQLQVVFFEYQMFSISYVFEVVYFSTLLNCLLFASPFYVCCVCSERKERGRGGIQKGKLFFFSSNLTIYYKRGQGL